MLEITHFELSAFLHAVLFAVALLAGFIDAIVGGSGLITLPALLICGVPPHLSLATNKLQSTFGSFTAAVLYYKSRTMPQLWLGVLASGAAAGLGAITALFVHTENLKFVILVSLTLTFFYMLWQPNLGNQKRTPQIKNMPIFYALVAAPIGFYDGFLGPGTGSFLIFVAITLLGYDLKTATVNTKLLNFASNIVALFTFLMLYQALWSVGLLMALGQIIGAYWGAKFVLKTKGTLIRPLFLMIVCATILKLAWDIFGYG